MIGRPRRPTIGYPFEKVSTLVQIILLSSRNFKIHPCRASESIPPGPKFPESFRTADLTTSSTIFKRIKTVFLSYASNVDQAVFFVRMFYLQYICDSFINNTRFIQCQFVGLHLPPLPPVSCLQINLIALNNLPHRMIFENLQ